jgi:hypothetical protein
MQGSLTTCCQTTSGQGLSCLSVSSALMLIPLQQHTKSLKPE